MTIPTCGCWFLDAYGSWEPRSAEWLDRAWWDDNTDVCPICGEPAGTIVKGEVK
jgi:hypothetical protein